MYVGRVLSTKVKHLLLFPQQPCDYILVSIPFLRTDLTQASQSYLKFVIEQYAACLNISSTIKNNLLITCST